MAQRLQAQCVNHLVIFVGGAECSAGHSSPPSRPVLLAGSALAAPVVVDPNFNQTSTTAPYYYGIVGWSADNVPPTPGYSGNPSFAGSVGFDPANQWNNGTPGNGQATVGFINSSTAATPGFIRQDISGFTVGSNYVITLLANGRVLNPQATAGLEIGVAPTSGTSSARSSAPSPVTVVYSNTAMTPVDAVGIQSTPFVAVTSSPFTANSTTLTVSLSNIGPTNSSVLLSGFSIALAENAVTPLPLPPVPEPMSLVLLGSGLAAYALARRRA